MSDSAQSSSKPQLPSLTESLRRFGQWCSANRLQAVFLLGLLGVLVWFYAFYGPLLNEHSFWLWVRESWNGDNDLEHGHFILPGAIVVAYLHRGDFSEAPIRPSWLGLLPLLTGIFFFIVAVWTLQPRIAFVALPLLILGCIWCLWGWPVTRIALLPAMLLLFMIPLGFLLSRTEPLQRLVGTTVTMISNLVGFGIDQDGVNLFARDGSFKFEVAGGCSGIRSIMAMTMLSLLYVHFTLKEPWKKLVVFAMTLPFAVIGNIVRVFSIVVVSKWISTELGTGPWHDISGFVVTIPIAVGAMILFSELLEKDWSGLKSKILTEDNVTTDVDAAPAATMVDSPEKPRSSSPISYDY